VTSSWRGRRDSEGLFSNSKRRGAKVLPYILMNKKIEGINLKTNKKQSKVKKLKGLGIVPRQLSGTKKDIEAQ